MTKREELILTPDDDPRGPLDNCLLTMLGVVVCLGLALFVQSLSWIAEVAL